MSSYQAVDITDSDAVEAAPVSNNRLGKVVLGLVAVAGTVAVVANRGSTASPLVQTELSYTKSSSVPTLHARHTLSLYEVMLQDSDMLSSVNMKIDYLMSGSSLAEHGYNLIDVNRYELCAQKTTEQSEWVPFVACMYSMQACLSYNNTAQSAEAGMTCSRAESGSDDDVTIEGLDSVGEDCECSVSGVAQECAAEHVTTKTFEELTTCIDSDEGVKWAHESSAIAEAANSGSPLWIKVDNITIIDSVNEVSTIESWAQTVFSSTCNRIEYLGGEKPDACDSVMANTISQSGTKTLH